MQHNNIAVLTLFYAAVVQVPTIVFAILIFFPLLLFRGFPLPRIMVRSSCGKPRSRLKILAISQITVRERQKLY